MTGSTPHNPDPRTPRHPPARWQFDAAELADLFALGALESAEESEFDQRLAAGDAALLSELARVRPVAEHLAKGLAAADPSLIPPTHLRDKVVSTTFIRTTQDASTNLPNPSREVGQSDAEIDRELLEEFAPSGPQHARVAAHTAQTGHAAHGPSVGAGGGVFVQRIAEGRWRPTGLPGVWAKPLFKDRRADRSTLLVKCEPGAYIPHHDHQGIEELIVLEGDLKVGETLLKAGDYIRTAMGQDHGDAFSPSGCICLFFTSHGVLSVRSQLSMFTAAMARWFARLLGR